MAASPLQVGFGQADIEKIVAVDPVIRVELKGKANNLEQIRARAQRAAGKPAPAAGSGAKDPVFQVGLLRVQGAQAILTGPNLKQPVEIGVKNLEMRNLEGTGSQIAGQIFARLLGNHHGKGGQRGRAAGPGQGHQQGGQLRPGRDQLSGKSWAGSRSSQPLLAEQ